MAKKMDGQSGHVVIYVVLLVLVVVVAGFSYLRIRKNNETPTTALNSLDSSSKQSSDSGSSSVSKPLTSGTDNASLQSDLGNINSSFSQQTADQNASNKAINDQSSEITVPTD